MDEKKKAAAIVAFLSKEYPGAGIALKSGNSFQLLVATILSAQCTDVKVNEVTRELFKKYRTAADFAGLDQKSCERDIYSTGFYRSKAKNIIAAARMVMKDFAGSVPQTMEELIRLPGVARKTANVVLYNAFGKIGGIAVDTHVNRLSRRLGLSRESSPVRIEHDLMRVVDKKEWGRLSHLLIAHGRKICAARKPKCFECVLRNICPSGKIFYS